MRLLERGETLAIIAVVLILLGLPAAVLGYQFVLRPAVTEVRTIDVVAAAPEAGGFQPDSIRVAAGETVRLRFSVPDVTHGIAIGPGLDLDLGQVDPGQVREVEVTFDQPGRYTFYCNTWCSPNHWRMRGAIDVFDPANADALIIDDTQDPVLDGLIARGVDIDASHDVEATPEKRPSAGRGAAVIAALKDELPSDLADPAWRRKHSPSDAWNAMTEMGLAGDEAWDAVAHLWLAQTDASSLGKASALYAKNCAACHGENGDGKGPGADAVQGMTLSDNDVSSLSDPRTMLGGTSEVYYAKLRRGGMGTGMPSFGPLLTSEESWALVDFLWTFVFDE